MLTNHESNVTSILIMPIFVKNALFEEDLKQEAPGNIQIQY